MGAPGRQAPGTGQESWQARLSAKLAELRAQGRPVTFAVAR
jgi:hypothetical protein